MMSSESFMLVSLLILGASSLGVDGARGGSVTLWGSYDQPDHTDSRRSLGERRELQDYEAVPVFVRTTTDDVLYTGMSSAPSGWTEAIGSRSSGTFSYSGTVVTFPDPDVGSSPGKDGGAIIWGAGVAPFDVFASESAATLSFWWKKLADSVRIGFGDKADVIDFGNRVVLKVGDFSPTVGEWYHLTVTKDAGASGDVTVYITSATSQTSVSIGSVSWSSLTSIYLGQSNGAPVHAEMGNFILGTYFADATAASTLYGYGSP